MEQCIELTHITIECGDVNIFSFGVENPTSNYILYCYNTAHYRVTGGVVHQIVCIITHITMECMYLAYLFGQVKPTKSRS